tara:strand:- start:562 stop:834 length:273 start_codon:yes stop_codon:yes gene_type:complete
MTKKKYKNKMNQKLGDPYKICQNCDGNGYVRIIPYSETQTCKQCKGAGHFENKKVKRTTEHEPATIDTQYVLNLIKLLEEFVRRGSKTIH